MDIDYDDYDIHNNFSIYSVKSIVNYIITNYHKFILLTLALFIIYFVDYISNINAFLYNGQNIPGLTNLKTPTPPLKLPKQGRKNKRK
jgi:hypothetical protein